MTKKELIEKLSQFSDDTIVVVETHGFMCPRIGYAVIGDHHLPYFPWFMETEAKKELLGKTIITIS